MQLGQSGHQNLPHPGTISSCALPILPGEPAFKAYFDQAVLAEHKRKSFQDIGDSGARLDPSAVDPGRAACLARLQAGQMPQAGEVFGSYNGDQDRGRGCSGGGGNPDSSSYSGGHDWTHNGGIHIKSQSHGGHGQSFGGRSQSVGGINLGGDSHIGGGGISNSHIGGGITHFGHIGGQFGHIGGGVGHSY